MEKQTVISKKEKKKDWIKELQSECQIKEKEIQHGRKR